MFYQSLEAAGGTPESILKLTAYGVGADIEARPLYSTFTLR